MTDAPNTRVPPTSTDAADKKSMRKAPRVAGPFEARRLGVLELPLRIHDLSLGGCLIESYHEVAVGRRFELEIDLPGEGWVKLQAETLYLREDFGFAVKFVEMDEQARVQLARAVVGLLREQKKAR